MSRFTRVPPMLFDLGTIVATQGAAASCSLDYLTACLLRHATGDWGSVCAADAQENSDAILTGRSILSVYPLDPAKPCVGDDNCLWIITEGDRSVTTFLLPSEY